MKKIIVILIVAFSLVVLMLFARDKKQAVTGGGFSAGQAVNEDTLMLDSTIVGISTVLTDLEVPWELAWGPDSCIWYTEQNGNISRFNPQTGVKHLLIKLPDLYRKRLGLLSMALHPDMKKAPFVFINYLFLKDSVVYAKVVRYTYQEDSLVNPVKLIEWPAHVGHNGSRIAIGPGEKLMIATGDITKDHTAQDSLTPNGKILRLNMDGSIPPDNPYPGSPVWARGFRVPQGLVFSKTGKLYSAEHGDATDDEVNLIQKGGNYGFPFVTGYCDADTEKAFCKEHNVIEPLKAWTPTIAPAGIDYYDNKSIPEWRNAILLVTLKTQSFRVLRLNSTGNRITGEHVFLEKKYGRLRDICISPNGDIYVSTSNRDWNPPDNFPVPHDDRILRIHCIDKIPRNKRVVNNPAAGQSKETHQDAATVYVNYCQSCHKVNGKGITGTYPPLAGNPFVTGNPGSVIKTVLTGLNGEVNINGVVYSQPMPAFKFLSDANIAGVVSYIRTHFNNATPVTTGDVKKARK
ncbi:MAG TPA: PQQ-dependent sugar dehydrogenase [Chitinophagaceae bacterium]|nr:PQQ-dependent sugar dehydrogenase [Chitinophagaceae bacterium]